MRFRSFLLLSFLSTFSVQMPPLHAQSNDDAFQALARAHSLESKTYVPWLLAATVTVVDPYTKQERRGSVKEAWLGDGKYVLTYALEKYESTLYVDGVDVRYTGSGEAYPGALAFALKKLLNPVNAPAKSSKLDRASRKIGSAQLDCLDNHRDDSHQFYCFAKGEKPLRFFQDGDVAVVFNHPVEFLGNDAAKDITLMFAGKAFARLHVDELRALKAEEIASFATTSDAKPYPFDGMFKTSHEHETSPRPLGQFRMENNEGAPVATLIQLVVTSTGKPKAELVATADNTLRPVNIQHAFPEFEPATRDGKPIASIGVITTSGPE